MASPLDQFKIKQLIPIEFGGLDFSFSNASLFMVATVIVIWAIMGLTTRRHLLIPSRGQSIAEMIYEFGHNLSRDIIGYQSRKFLPLVLSLFMTILVANLLGMVPYGFTVTSHIAVTAAFGALVIIVTTIAGFVNHGVKFLTIFAPSGLPLPIYLILIPVEIISFLSRPVTLAVRLGANMIAGHTMLVVFAGFSVQLGVLFGLGPMLFNATIVAFELLVAVLQAYIFTILTCIYLRDAAELHH